MKSVIEEIWDGNVCPDSDLKTTKGEVRELMKYLADHHDNLYATLNEHQKDILERFDDCYAELTSINERDIFVYAFRLGARIAIEIMQFGVG